MVLRLSVCNEAGGGAVDAQVEGRRIVVGEIIGGGIPVVDFVTFVGCAGHDADLVVVGECVMVLESAGEVVVGVPVECLGVEAAVAVGLAGNWRWVLLILIVVRVEVHLLLLVVDLLEEGVVARGSYKAQVVDDIPCEVGDRIDARVIGFRSPAVFKHTRRAGYGAPFVGLAVLAEGGHTGLAIIAEGAIACETEQAGLL